MGHHAEHIPSGVADSGDIFQRSVGVGFGRDLALIVGVAKDYAIVAIQLGQSFIVAKIIAFHVADWDGQDFAFAATAGERSLVVFDSQMDLLADIFQTYVAHQRSGQQS